MLSNNISNIHRSGKSLNAIRYSFFCNKRDNTLSGHKVENTGDRLVARITTDGDGGQYLVGNRGGRSTAKERANRWANSFVFILLVAIHVGFGIPFISLARQHFAAVCGRTHDCLDIGNSHPRS